MGLFFHQWHPNSTFQTRIIDGRFFKINSVVVVPIKSKGEMNVAAGIIEALDTIKGKTKMIYADDEAASSTEAIQYNTTWGRKEYTAASQQDTLISVREPSALMTICFTNKAADEKKGKQHIHWRDYNLDILLTYNNKIVHCAIKNDTKWGSERKDSKL